VNIWIKRIGIGFGIAVAAFIALCIVAAIAAPNDKKGTPELATTAAQAPVTAEQPKPVAPVQTSEPPVSEKPSDQPVAQEPTREQVVQKFDAYTMEDYVACQFDAVAVMAVCTSNSDKRMSKDAESLCQASEYMAMKLYPYAENVLIASGKSNNQWKNMDEDLQLKLQQADMGALSSDQQFQKNSSAVQECAIRHGDLKEFIGKY
jgi:hypothetical protein